MKRPVNVLCCREWAHVPDALRLPTYRRNTELFVNQCVSGLVVKSIVAKFFRTAEFDGPRVRFTADALFFCQFSLVG